MRKEVETIYKRDYGTEWPGSDPDKFLEWFKAKINSIPAEFRDSARVVIGSEEDNYVPGWNHPTISICYYTRG